MTTETIHEAAKAAYRVYFGTRITRQWHTDSVPVQRRWERVAAMVLNGNIKRPPDLRFRYFEGYFCVRPWEDIPRLERDRWDRALESIKWVGDAAMIAGKDAA